MGAHPAVQPAQVLLHVGLQVRRGDTRGGGGLTRRGRVGIFLPPVLGDHTQHHHHHVPPSHTPANTSVDAMCWSCAHTINLKIAHPSSQPPPPRPFSPLPPRPSPEALLAWCAASRPLLPTATPEDLAVMAWAFSLLGFLPPAPWWDAWVDAAAGGLHVMAPRQLVGLARAWGRWGVTPGPAFMRLYMRAACDRWVWGCGSGGSVCAAT